jgi:uncharacterized protein (TIGR02996 family)
MDQGVALLEALHASPADDTGWLILADWLEEQGQPERAELVRLVQALRHVGADWTDPQRQRTPRSRMPQEARLRQLLDAGVAPCVPERVNSAGMRLALIPAGSFWMGSPSGEEGRHSDEHPRHRVEITRPFYLGVYPVTQEEYRQVTGTNPSHFCATGAGKNRVKGSALDTKRFPVESVWWKDAVAFCKKLSALPAEKAAGRVYRLPTEAEWEYACRAGTTSIFHYGNSLSSHRANVDGNLPERDRKGLFLARPCPVGQYPLNAFGLYDMHGNVWEWCADWFKIEYYEKSPNRDPTGPARGTLRALRGGSWQYGARIARSAYRFRAEPDSLQSDFGFRVALDVALP